MIKAIEDAGYDTGSVARVNRTLSGVRAPVRVQAERFRRTAHTLAQINSRDFGTVFKGERVAERHSQR